MKQGQNSNRPAPGSRIKVEPIRELKDIKAIKRLLADSPRDLCLFTFGINTNLRASDLLQITAGMVRGLKAGDEIELKERKTGKVRKDYPEQGGHFDCAGSSGFQGLQG